MATPTSDLTVPAPVAVSIVLSVIALSFLAARALERRTRRRAGRLLGSLASAFRRFLQGSLSAAGLARATRRADEGACWTVLESLSLRIARGDWLRVSRALAGSVHAATERRALASDSPWRRVLAARRLGLLRSRASRRALRRAMVRGPEMVALAGAMSLARYRDRAALRWLLAHQEVLGTRHRNALVGLLLAWGRNVLPVMAEALMRGGSLPRFELALIDALGARRHRAAQPVLLRVLGEGGLDSRTAAARALGRLRADGSAPALMTALDDDAWQVRAQAARALGRLRATQATEALAPRLTDRSWWVRRHAAYALMEMGGDGEAALRRIIATSADPYARDMAREALDREFTRRTG